MNYLKLSGLMLAWGLVWNAVFIAGAVALEESGPFTVLALGLLGSALLSLIVARKNGNHVRDPQTTGLGCLLGILMGAVGLGGLFGALNFIPSYWVMAAGAIFPLLSGVFALPEKGGWKQLGLLVAYIGLILLVSGPQKLDETSSLGLILAGLGALGLSLGTVLYWARGRTRSDSGLAFWASLSGAVFLLPAALLEGSGLGGLSLKGVVALAILALSLTLAVSGHLALNRRHLNLSILYPLFVPLIGLLAGRLFLGLSVGFWETLSLPLLMLGFLMAGEVWSKTGRPVFSGETDQSPAAALEKSAEALL